MAQTADAHGRVPALRRRPPRPSGIPYEFLTPGARSATAGRWCAPRTSIGALFHPTDGYINPADVTQAMAKGARQRGVEIVRKRAGRRLSLDRREWIVSGREDGGPRRQPRADRGALRDHAPSMSSPPPATTPSAPRGCSASSIPAIPVEHQYIVTEPDPALRRVAHAPTPSTRCCATPTPSWYVREERGGWILGPYEKGAPARFEYGVPESFRADLFPLDLERIEAEYMSMIHRIPSSEIGGPQGRLQRPDLLHARRQPAGRAGAGAAQPVAGGGLLLRHHRRRRHRPLPRADDGRGRGRDRHGLARPASASAPG